MPRLSKSAMSKVETHIGFLNQTLMVWKTITFNHQNCGRRGVSEDLIETVTLNGLKRVSQMDILGKSLISRLASECKGPEEPACSKNSRKANIAKGK